MRVSGYPIHNGSGRSRDGCVPPDREGEPLQCHVPLITSTTFVILSVIIAWRLQGLDCRIEWEPLQCHVTLITRFIIMSLMSIILSVIIT